MILTFFISLIIPVLAFFFEVYPRLLNRKVGVDIWTHLLYLQEYKEQNGIPKKIEKGFIVPGEYDYPPMFITILSKFPLRIVERYEFFFSPFFDPIHICIIFYITLALSGNILVALTTQLLYTLTPIIIIENSSATPRSLGYMLFTGVFLSLYYSIHLGNIPLFIAAAGLGSLIFLSHRFTTQGFLFFAGFFTLIEMNIFYLVCFVCSFVGAMIISKGFYLKVLHGHLGNLSFWYKNIKYRFYHQVKGGRGTHKTTDFVFKVYNQFISIPPVVLAVTNPWVLFVFISLFFISYSGIHYYLLLWVGFSYLLSLLTIGIEKMRFLGEGQRYLELSAFPSAYLASAFLINSFPASYGMLLVIAYIGIGIAAFVTVVVIQRKAIVKDRLRTLTPDLERMYHYLKRIKKKPRLLCIPHQITTNTIYHTGCPVFVNADYKNIQKIAEVYPYLKKPVKEVMSKYSLDAVLLNEEYATINDLKLKKYKEVKRYNNIVLLELLS